MLSCHKAHLCDRAPEALPRKLLAELRVLAHDAGRHGNLVPHLGAALWSQPRHGVMGQTLQGRGQQIP